MLVSLGGGSHIEYSEAFMYSFEVHINSLLFEEVTVQQREHMDPHEDSSLHHNTAAVFNRERRAH